MKKKIGITGQNGFVGQHLYNSLKQLNDEFELIEFKRDYFKDLLKLQSFVKNCDVIVHLASINRSQSERKLFEINCDLTRTLISAIENTSSKPHVLFSSSVQEHNENSYGKSKKISRTLLSNWALRNGANFTGMIIPNVFGPFGKPFYNSVISTFCHQLTNNDNPLIKNDKQLKLIYVGDLVNEIIKIIRISDNSHECFIKENSLQKVSEILTDLSYYRDLYILNDQIPVLNSDYEIQLFNTFRSFIDLNSNYPKKLSLNTDNRGVFVEIIRSGISGQTSFSTTKPGVTRGNHFHTRKIERFSVIKGNALIQMRRVGTRNILSFELNGDAPSYVDMPIWYTHNLKNIGNDDLLTVFWINEPFDPNDPDTYFENV